MDDSIWLRAVKAWDEIRRKAVAQIPGSLLNAAAPEDAKLEDYSLPHQFYLLAKPRMRKQGALWFCRGFNVGYGGVVERSGWTAEMAYQNWLNTERNNLR